MKPRSTTTKRELLLLCEQKLPVLKKAWPGTGGPQGPVSGWAGRRSLGPVYSFRRLG